MTEGRLHLNLDCGERGFADPLDLELLPLVDQVNIACGGHAGDPATARDLAARAADAGVAVACHPSYPDRAHFGRSAPPIMPWPILADCLTAQRLWLPQVRRIKFHGALYNHAAEDLILADRLAGWCRWQNVEAVLAPPASALALACERHGLACLREGFVDRAYVAGPHGPQLMPRSRPGSLFDDAPPAVAQLRSVVAAGLLPIVDADPVPFRVDTWCVHGDGPAAAAIIRAVRAARL